MPREVSLADALRPASTERTLEILGEALNRLLRVDPAAFSQTPDARRAIAMRNIIAHGDDVVDPAILWDTVQNDLPVIAAAIERLRAP